MTVFKDPDFSTYRKCVGMIIVHPDGNKVLAFERSDHKESWQLPQGGVDEGEDELEAARRELFEETGLKKDSMELLALHPEWLGYDIPEKVIKKNKFSHKGQVQKWFLFTFKGQEKDIDLSKAEHKEFSQYQWMTPDELSKQVIDFKKEVYTEVFDHFKSIIAS